MAPAAVQTKHWVWTNTGSAPALFTHSAMAGACTPSLSPKMITCLPFNSTDIPPHRNYIDSFLQLFLSNTLIFFQ